MTIKLSTKNNLIDLVFGRDSGLYRTYILDSTTNNKLDKIVYSAAKIIEKLCCEISIEVKYQYGRRSKRLEIVYLDGNCYNLCKLTTFNKFDKDALELRSVVEDIRLNDSFKKKDFNGVLIFDDKYNQVIVESFLKLNAPGFRHIDINHFE